MQYINHTVLIGESPEEENCRIEEWKEALEVKGLMISRDKYNFG